MSDDELILGLESALLLDSFSLQGEYMVDEVDQQSGGDVTMSGWYAQASYFLTGEHRNYSKSTSAFDRIRPNKNFGTESGSGAWELAARVSQLDLNDTDITSALRGRQTNFTLGTNWYLNPNTRIMLNWVHADVDGVGDSDSIAMRFQVDF